MEKEQFCYSAASKIYDYYYNLAIKEFSHEVSNGLAKIPADYVYDNLNKTYPNCHIDERCCLEYCNEMLDSEFDRLSPDFKRNLYNKSSGIQSSISNSEINMHLKAKRRKFKSMYVDAVRRVKEQQENDISNLLNGIRISKRKNSMDNIDNVLKNMRLN